jgi:hypothetical protein
LGAGPGRPQAIDAKSVYKYGTLVASVQIRRPPPPPPEPKEGEPPPPVPVPTGPGIDQGTTGEVHETLTPALLEPLVVPQKKQKEPKRPKVDEDKIIVTPPDVTMPPADAGLRYYLVVGVNRRGDRGTPGTRVQVPTWTPPDTPSDVVVTVKQDGNVITWTAPAHMRKPVGPLNPSPAPVPVAVPGKPGAPAPGAPAPTAAPPPGAPEPTAVPLPPSADDDEDEAEDETVAPPTAPVTSAPETSAPAPTVAPAQPGTPTTAPGAPAAGTPAAGAPAAATTPGGAAAAGQTPATAPLLTPEGLLPSRLPIPWPVSNSGFVVYEVAPPNFDATSVPPLPAAQPFPRLLTPTPIQTTTFTDARIEFGATRCYVVRTVDMIGPGSIQSVSSPPVCVKPKDTFAPAAPKSLQAVASEGAISLIWDANTETDLAGYIVLRAAASSNRFEPITPAPIRETTYRDTAVRRGVRYVYVVIAVDTATPPNRSEFSNRVDEAAR